MVINAVRIKNELVCIIFSVRKECLSDSYNKNAIKIAGYKNKVSYNNLQLVKWPSYAVHILKGHQWFRLRPMAIRFTKRRMCLIPGMPSFITGMPSLITGMPILITGTPSLNLALQILICDLRFVKDVGCNHYCMLEQIK